MFCTQCGRSLEEGDAYCTNCGAPVGHKQAESCKFSSSCAPSYARVQPNGVKSYLIPNLLLLLCTCGSNVIALIGLIFSILTRHALNNGNMTNARTYSEVAFICMTISLVLLGIALIALAFFVPFWLFAALLPRAW